MKKVRETSLSFLAIVLLYYLLHLLNIGCPIKFLTGISCAGCGMTRAWISLLNLKIQQAFYYHPLFFVPPIFILVYFIKSRLSKRCYKTILFTFIVTFGIIYVIRLCGGASDIVVWRPHEGFIYKIIEVIFGREKNVL